MAEAFLFPLAEKLLGKIATASFREIGRLWGVETDLKRLEGTLSAIKAVLSDAAHQPVDSEQVRDWLDKLQDVLYEIDDLFDDFMTEDKRRQLEIGESKLKKVGNFFSISNPLKFRFSMSRKIANLRRSLDDISEDRRKYQFVERVLSNEVEKQGFRGTHGYVDRSDIIGREGEIEEITHLLLSPNLSHDASNIGILPIVGIGGIGKTALIKRLYMDRDVTNEFDVNIWVAAVGKLERDKVLKEILKFCHVYVEPNWELEQLRMALHKCLESKKFLLFLDDVWDEDPVKWKKLRDLLRCGAKGSMIVVTTRSKKIAEMMGTLAPYSLSGLSTDDCLSIFLRWAFNDEGSNASPRLVEIGKEIVKKCGGVPLAVRTVACMLRHTTEESRWKFVSDTEIWKLAQEEDSVLPILRLSYERMPIHQRQCFAYCATFPKDVELFAKELIYGWISNGLIQSNHSYISQEDIGSRYIRELTEWSFFKDVEYDFSNEIFQFKMNDLMHDLAVFVAGKEVVHFDPKETLHENVRHLLFTKGNAEGQDSSGSLLKLQKVRSFIFHPEVGPISSTWLDALIKSFKRLRLLDIGDMGFELLPDTIGTLRHLRYLRLANNHTITALPKSFCKLLNLLALYLNGCDRLQRLPYNFQRLRCLRYLSFTSEMACLAEMDLAGLSSLRYFEINGCQNLESLSDEGLQHLTALHEFRIEDCPRLTSIPQSMKFLTSLKKLHISRCEKLNVLERQGFEGLRSLEDLALYELPMLRELPLGPGNATANLRYLRISCIPSIESLPGLGSCTSLSKLQIRSCKRLASLSSDLPQLSAMRYLEIGGCSLLTPKFETGVGEYWPWISSIAEVHINNEAERS